MISYSSDRNIVGGCLGAALVLLLFNLLLGGFCFDFSLWALFGKDIPWYADLLCGLFLGQFVIPIAFIAWILSFFIAIPFFV